MPNEKINRNINIAGPPLGAASFKVSLTSSFRALNNSLKSMTKPFRPNIPRVRNAGLPPPIAPEPRGVQQVKLSGKTQILSGKRGRTADRWPNWGMCAVWESIGINRVLIKTITALVLGIRTIDAQLMSFLYFHLSR